MTTHWPNIAHRVAAQVRLFGSNIEPEILGAVRGIGRTLRSHAMDFHDFAEVIERGAEKRKSYRRSGVPPQWSAMPAREQIAWLNAIDMDADALSARERDFLDFLVGAMARPYPRLTDAQIAFVNSMVVSAWRRGINP